MNTDSEKSTPHYDTTSLSQVDDDYPVLILTFSDKGDYNSGFFGIQDQQNVVTFIVETYEGSVATIIFANSIPPKDIQQKTGSITTHFANKNLFITQAVSSAIP